MRSRFLVDIEKHLKNKVTEVEWIARSSEWEMTDLLEKWYVFLLFGHRWRWTVIHCSVCWSTKVKKKTGKTSLRGWWVCNQSLTARRWIYENFAKHPMCLDKRMLPMGSEMETQCAINGEKWNNYSLQMSQHHLVSTSWCSLVASLLSRNRLDHANNLPYTQIKCF